MNSSLPFWLQYLQALSVPIVACFGAFIAYRQYRIGREKLRLDLFEKRFETFSLAERFAQNVLRDGYPKHEDFILSWKARGNARFLFDEDVGATLKSLHDHASKLRFLNNRIENSQYAERNADIEKLHELSLSFNTAFEDLPKVFERYLRFPR